MSLRIEEDVEASGVDGSRPDELHAERVYTRVRDAILRGEIVAEEPISQVRLAKQLGVSRTPLREALRMLQREGLIESEPNRRVRVPALSLTDLEGLYALRVVTEALAIRLSVPSFTSGDIDDLDRLLEEMHVASEGHDVDRWAVPHREYHDVLRKYSGARIVRMARELSDHSERYHRVHLAEPRAWSPAEQEHRAIVDACKARDADAASTELARHLARTPLSIIAIAHPSHEPAVVRAALCAVTLGPRAEVM